MPIAVICPSCQTAIQAPDTMAGQQGKCQTCGAIVTVPGVTGVQQTQQPSPAPEAAPVSKPAGAAPSATSSSRNTSAKSLNTNANRDTLAAPESPSNASPTPKITAAAAAQMAGAKRAQGSVNAGWSTSPNSTAVKPKPDSRQFQQQVLGAFQGPIVPIDLDTSYELGMIAALGVMLLLPVVYFGLIGLIVLGMYFYGVNFGHLVAAGASRGLITLVFSVILYITPLLTGGILLVFMIKPLVARRRGGDDSRLITREQEPLLFAFVDKICDIVGAPPPSQVAVDSQVNASASFRRGVWSMLSDDDLSLSIGMPLVAGMTMQQFAGILAHEFGHFTQGAGMRTIYLVRHINLWFARVVYERDEWDAWLERMSRGDFKQLFIVAKGVVWLVRKPLWLLMLMGNMVTGFVLREMERDADRHEIRLAGTPAFRETTWRLNVLMAAHQWALADLGQFSRDGKLADNLPELIMANVHQLPKELLQHLEDQIQNTETSWLDSHPADRDRIQLAADENSPGVFHLDQPARLLFNHYQTWCQYTTSDLYRELFGPLFDLKNVYPVEQLVESQQVESEQSKALRRYSQSIYSPLRALRLPNWQIAPPTDESAYVTRLGERRAQIQQHRVAMHQVLETFLKQDDHFVAAWRAAALLGAGYRLDPREYEFAVHSKAAAEGACNAAEHQLQQLGQQLETFEAALGERLWISLCLLHAPQTASQIPDAAARIADSQNVLNALRIIGQTLPSMLLVRNGLQRLNALGSQLDGKNANDALYRAIGSTLEQIYEALSRVRTECSTVAYPLEHTRGPMSLGQYLVKTMPTLEDISGVCDAADRAMDRFVATYVRLTARLTTLSEHVESAWGLPPLPDIAETQG